MNIGLWSAVEPRTTDRLPHSSTLANDARALVPRMESALDLGVEDDGRPWSASEDPVRTSVEDDALAILRTHWRRPGHTGVVFTTGVVVWLTDTESRASSDGGGGVEWFRMPTHRLLGPEIVVLQTLRCWRAHTQPSDFAALRVLDRTPYPSAGSDLADATVVDAFRRDDRRAWVGRVRIAGAPPNLDVCVSATTSTPDARFAFGSWEWEYEMATLARDMLRYTYICPRVQCHV